MLSFLAYQSRTFATLPLRRIHAGTFTLMKGLQYYNIARLCKHTKFVSCVNVTLAVDGDWRIEERYFFWRHKKERCFHSSWIDWQYWLWQARTTTSRPKLPLQRISLLFADYTFFFFLVCLICWNTFLLIWILEFNFPTVSYLGEISNSTQTLEEERGGGGGVQTQHLWSESLSLLPLPCLHIPSSLPSQFWGGGREFEKQQFWQPRVRKWNLKREGAALVQGGPLNSESFLEEFKSWFLCLK